NRRKSASSVKHEIEKELKVTISNQTVRRRAHEVGLYGRVARKKPYINKSSKKLKLGPDMVFQHDNDPKHTSRIVKNWLDKHRVKRLIWPPFSPDMNPIEHLWDELERRMKEHQPKNQKELRETLQAEWQNIGPDVTNKLVESVPNRLYECSRMKRYPTRY
ncbi:unnamed protein product, partial [Rotaria magnacalcarata]